MPALSLAEWLEQDGPGGTGRRRKPLRMAIGRGLVTGQTSAKLRTIRLIDKLKDMKLISFVQLVRSTWVH